MRGGTDPFSRVIDEFNVLVAHGSRRFSAVKMRQSPARERSQLPGSPTTVDEQVLAGDVASRIADEQ